MTVLLLDNSVVQRIGRAESVRDSILSLLEQGYVLAVSDVTRLEAGYSATGASHHQRVMRGLDEDFQRLPVTREVGETAVQLQKAMFTAGRGRAVGPGDLLHAATAIVHDAVVGHYDRDFEQLAEVDGRFRHQWIVPRGSVD